MRLIASIAALIVSATITNAEIHASGPSLLHGVLTSAPVASLFSKIGIDISKTLENPDYWDERIPLITDDNYNDIVVNELLTEEEEEARTWAIIMSVLIIFWKVYIHYSTVQSQVANHQETASRSLWTRCLMMLTTNRSLLVTYQVFAGDASTISTSPISQPNGTYGGEPFPFPFHSCGYDRP
jgi:hypothetical protein